MTTTEEELRAIAARHEAAAPAMAEIQRLISDPAFKAAVRDPRSLQEHRDIGTLLELLRSVPDLVTLRLQDSGAQVYFCANPKCQIGTFGRKSFRHHPECPGPLLEMIRGQQ